MKITQLTSSYASIINEQSSIAYIVSPDVAIMLMSETFVDGELSCTLPIDYLDIQSFETLNKLLTVRLTSCYTY